MSKTMGDNAIKRTMKDTNQSIKQMLIQLNKCCMNEDMGEKSNCYHSIEINKNLLRNKLSKLNKYEHENSCTHLIIDSLKNIHETGTLNNTTFLLMYSVLFSVNSLQKTQSEIIGLIGKLCEKQWRNIEYAKPRDDEAYKNRFIRQSFDKISIYVNDYLTNMIYETRLYRSDIELLDIVDEIKKNIANYKRI